MKKSPTRILIVDDKTENLDAAKLAAANFPEYEFRFTNSAKEAAESLEDTDAVITDLFFPNEGHDNLEEELGMCYSLYRQNMSKDNPAFDQVLSGYYCDQFSRALGKLKDTLGILQDGTIRKAVERLIDHFEMRNDSSHADEYRELLRNLPAPQFPYGGAIMFRAKELGLRQCLVTDIHRHAGMYQDARSAIDGMMLLMPLIGAGILTVDEAQSDGKKCYTYMGNDAIWPIGKKSDPAVWAEAIRRVMQESWAEPQLD